MRTVGKLTLAFTGAFLFVTLAGGQQPIPFGGGFGGKGGGGGADPLALLRNDSVKKELNLTDEQTTKIPEAVQKALAEVLDAKQLKRLREIELQQRGPAALGDARVQKDLKVSEEQAASIKTIFEDSKKQQAELAKEFGKGGGGKGGGGFKGMGEKFQTLQKETNDKVQEVLTAEQRRAWKQMQGDEFKIATPTFGGFGGNFNKKNKKDDGF